MKPTDVRSKKACAGLDIADFVNYQQMWVLLLCVRVNQVLRAGCRLISFDLKLVIRKQSTGIKHFEGMEI